MVFSSIWGKMKATEGLKKNEDFQKVYKAGRSKSDRAYVLYVLPNGLEVNRLGVSVSKKVGNSVVRHRIKRLVKEACRLNDARFHKGFDLVVIARGAASSAGYRDTERSLLKLACSLHAAEESGNDAEAVH